MDRNAALEKIKKCLRLSKSANEHEAAAALRQAQKLMELHGIDAATLQLSDVAEATAPARSAALPQWEVSLARAVADAFGCEVIVMRGYKLAFDKQHRRTKYLFIGVGPAAEVAAYAQDVLAGQCARARMAHIASQPKNCKQITKTARGDAFAKAWVWGVQSTLDRFAGSEHNVALLKAYVTAKHPALVDVKPARRDLGRNVHDNSMAAGLAAGRQAKLGRGIGNLNQELLK